MLSAPATSARPVTAARVPDRARARAAGGEEVDAGRDASRQDLRALLPREEREERLSVHEQHAVSNASLHLRRCSRRRERELRSHDLVVGGRRDERDAVARRGGETREADDVLRAQRVGGVPEHRRDPRRAPAQPARRRLGRRPRNRRRIRRHVDGARIREREPHGGAGAVVAVVTVVIALVSAGGRVPPRYPSRYATPTTASSAKPSSTRIRGLANLRIP